MTSRALTGLLMAVGVVLCMAIPTGAEATTAQKAAERTLQSGNLDIVGPESNLECEHSELIAELTSNASKEATGPIGSASFSECQTYVEAFEFDFPATVQAGAAGWKLQIQAAEESGQVTAHVEAESESGIQISQKFFSQSCDYEADSIELMGSSESSELTVIGENQLQLEPGSPEVCGETATLEGSFALSSEGKEASAVVETKALAKGDPLKGQSTDLSMSSVFGTYECAYGEFSGEVTANGGEDVSSSFNKVIFNECRIPETTAKMDIIFNVVSHPWSLQVQQPTGEWPGQITAHIEPAPESALEITQQVQFGEGDFTTCKYKSEGLDLMGAEGSNRLVVSGEHQFVRVSGSTTFCEEKMTLKGTIAIGSGARLVTVDMT